MRGGTSKALFVHDRDVPAAGTERWERRTCLRFKQAEFQRSFTKRHMKIIKKSTHPRAFTCGAAAVLAMLGQSALAQSSVTLYGTVDGGVALLRSGAPGVGTLTAVTTGVSSGSKWGLRGSEDLGGGLKAIFQLEAGLELDTGAAKAFSGNPSTATPTAPNGVSATGFNRRSYVGLQSNYGTLTLGRDYTPVYYASLAADIFRLGLFGNLQATVGPAGGSERYARASNAVFYTSPEFNGIKARAVYSLGSESTGAAGGLPKEANRFFGVGAEYANAGLVLTASFQELEYPVVGGTPAAFTGATDKRRDGLIGAKYSFGNFAVAGGYWKITAPQNATDAWLGASMNIGRGTVLAQVQRLRQDNPTGAEREGTVFGLGYVHNLSKQTALYASYGRVSNNATGAFALASSDVSVAAGAPGADPSALGFGIRHNF